MRTFREHPNCRINNRQTHVCLLSPQSMWCLHANQGEEFALETTESSSHRLTPPCVGSFCKSLDCESVGMIRRWNLANHWGLACWLVGYIFHRGKLMPLPVLALPLSSIVLWRHTWSRVPSCDVATYTHTYQQAEVEMKLLPPSDDSIWFLFSKYSGMLRKNVVTAGFWSSTCASVMYCLQRMLHFQGVDANFYSTMNDSSEQHPNSPFFFALFERPPNTGCSLYSPRKEYQSG